MPKLVLDEVTNKKVTVFKGFFNKYRQEWWMNNSKKTIKEIKKLIDENWEVSAYKEVIAYQAEILCRYEEKIKKIKKKIKDDKLSKKKQ
jgi:2C-methyl-D-erythritol 2,4-cyclodiphosphate synthase